VDLANSLELDWLVISMNPRSSLRFCFAAVLLPILIATSGCNGRSTAQAAAAPAFSAATAPPTAPVSDSDAMDAKHFTTSGPLVADQQADIAAERDGRVVSIAVEIGDHVQRGQLLASLDDRALRAAVDSQTAHIASLKAQVGEWESEQKMDEADLRRADQMRDDKILSEENWEHVKYKLDEVIAEVARYRADLTASQSRILAPFAGVVGRRSLRLAQEVKKGDVLFWITAEAPLRILFTVPESAMSAYTVGAPLELTTTDYPELRQPARILRVSPVVDPASGSIQVIGALLHPSHLLKPGMSMQVRPARQDSDAK
jgi:membrane fusion protein (multidrug efflux system)